ncbi:TPA: SDH family Clp fold serine proteinase [Legionella pneumophila]|nr:S49 family peptidase [Legionella pneumophila]HAT8123895.1 S49 family peptidase [Legionella pneumophila]HAU0773264.1 S49 family peptidase [Legionella pneumophila]HAU0871350.1 S49 family peptidase [Legionella pneumophila]HAU0889662.1 S49 family peptidase [Legionella pneumophila]
MPNWNDVLKEIDTARINYTHQAHSAIDEVRRSYLEKLHNKTGRNIIAYYSAFLSKPNIAQTIISDEDKNGFMMAIHNLDREKGLDLILHTQGGDIAATESIANYLHKMFGDNIRAIVPQIAMSAGTMLACSCQSILMGKQSNLGPIDPHLGGIPAHGVVAEFKRANEEIKADPNKAILWAQIISKYHPTFLGQCENAIKWASSFVEEQLKTIMFKNDQDKDSKAKEITDKLSDFHDNKTHSRHIHAEECKKLGLNIIDIEPDQELQDLILTVHHCYMHSLTNTASCKIIENNHGIAFVKQQIS